MKKIVLFIIISFIGFWAFPDGFLFLEVDGIKVEIDDIVFGKNYANHQTTASISLNRTINLTGDPNDVFSGGITLMLERDYDNLEFEHININMSGGVSIKGHAYDSDTSSHIYTTAAGIASVNLGTDIWTAQSNYDYLHKDYIYYEGDNGNQNETTFMSSEVTYDPVAGIDISLLVDTYKVAYYWDGTDAARHGFVQTWHWENSAYFPTGTPVIGLTYMPFYVSVNRNVTSETYVVTSATSFSGGALDGLPNEIDEKRSMIMTLVFDNDTGDFFIGRTANWDNLTDYTLDLPQFIKSGTLSGGTYTLNFSSYDQENGGWTDNQTISGFTRPASVGGSGQATVNSGGSSYTLHYERVD